MNKLIVSWEYNFIYVQLKETENITLHWENKDGASFLIVKQRIKQCSTLEEPNGIKIIKD